MEHFATSLRLIIEFLDLSAIKKFRLSNKMICILCNPKLKNMNFKEADLIKLKLTEKIELEKIKCDFTTIEKLELFSKSHKLKTLIINTFHPGPSDKKVVIKGIKDITIQFLIQRSYFGKIFPDLERLKIGHGIRPFQSSRTPSAVIVKPFYERATTLGMLGLQRIKNLKYLEIKLYYHSKIESIIEKLLTKTKLSELRLAITGNGLGREPDEIEIRVKIPECSTIEKISIDGLGAILMIVEIKKPLKHLKLNHMAASLEIGGNVEVLEIMDFMDFDFDTKEDFKIGSLHVNEYWKHTEITSYRHRRRKLNIDRVFIHEYKKVCEASSYFASCGVKEIYCVSSDTPTMKIQMTNNIIRAMEILGCIGLLQLASEGVNVFFIDERAVSKLGKSYIGDNLINIGQMLMEHVKRHATF